MNTQIEKNIFDMILEFFYTISYWLGEKIVTAVQSLFPEAVALNQLIEPIGMLAILTIVLLVAQIARKIAWVIVAVGWVLIIIRVILIITLK